MKAALCLLAGVPVMLLVHAAVGSYLVGVMVCGAMCALIWTEDER